MADGFWYDVGESLHRPAAVRRLRFEDLWVVGGEHAGAAGVVPLELLDPRDRQAGIFVARGDRRPGTWGSPANLDVLARFPGIESVVGLGPVVARTPLPHIREVSAAQTDEETLGKLPNLETLAIFARIGSPRFGTDPIDVSALPASVRWLRTGADTFGSLEALAERLPHLERLRVHGLWREGSAEPLAAFAGLRWLGTDAAKGLHHLARLTELELLDLDLDPARLTNLRRFKTLSRLRVLRVSGGLKSLEGIQALETLEQLDLRGTVAVDDLSPLTGLPALATVRLRHVPRVTDFAPLGTLPALRRLVLDLGDITDDQTLSTLRWLDGLHGLEELELEGVDVTDADPRPLYRLERLSRAKLIGRFGATEEELRAQVPAEDLFVHVRADSDPGVAVGPVRYRRLPDGTWTIFANLAAQLGTASNLDAEDRARGAIRDEDFALHDRLVFDSEADALAITATSEDDIRRAATVIAALAGA